MRKLILSAIISVLTVTAVRAGLYIPGEPGDLVLSGRKASALLFDQFRLRLGEVRGAQFPEPLRSALGRAYDSKAKELLSRKGRLSPTEMITLGGYLYRLNDLDGAAEWWKKAAGAEPRNFFAISDLATVRHAEGKLEEALNIHEVLSLKPLQLPGLSLEQSAWDLGLEAKWRALLRGRFKEKIKQIQPNQLTPDDLFGVQFVAEDGTYKPGEIAAVQKAKLPEEAIAIVQQLLLWVPGDSRLYWLLAELYNAAGQPEAALTIMNECSDSRRFQPDLLREHRQILQEYQERKRAEQERLQAEQERLRAEEEAAAAEKDFKKHPEIIWAVGIVGAVLLAALVSWQAWLVIRKVRRK